MNQFLHTFVSESPGQVSPPPMNVNTTRRDTYGNINSTILGPSHMLQGGMGVGSMVEPNRFVDIKVILTSESWVVAFTLISSRTISPFRQASATTAVSD